MACYEDGCLKEANAKCKACETDWCDDHILQCESCLDFFCKKHLDKHECKKEENEKLTPSKKSKIENNNANHSVALRKSGGIDINTINKIDTVLEIHHIDVGQGDATLILIKSYKGDIYKSILIDSGKTSKPITDYFDQLINQEKDGKKYFRPIDILITTHPDKDHVGGAADILTGKNEATNLKYTNPEAILYDNGTPFGKFDSNYENYLNCAKEKGFSRQRPPLGAPIEGGKILEEHGVILRCLAFNGVMTNGYSEESLYYHPLLGNLEADDFHPEKEQQMIEAYYPTNDNNLSIALHLQFGKFSYFTAGDLSGEYEEKIAHHINFFYGPVSAWKASHHGAKECTSEMVAGFLQGGVCVFSFGVMNEFGHPFQAPIDHLENLNKAGVSCTYYCTGNILHRDLPSRQYGKLGDHGRANQGAIVITAVESEVRINEKFYVRSSISNDMYELKPRKQELLAVAPSEYKEKSGNPLSEEKKTKKAINKRLRILKKLEQAKEALQEIIMVNRSEKWDDIYKDKFKKMFDEKAIHFANSAHEHTDYKNNRDDKGRVARAAEELKKYLRHH
ncbi:MAG TPA: hypothetical protein PKY50_13550 [Candidatus Competibacter sp.]|nr:hypothetical protein [Candidatus Competibacter sp.]